MARDVPFLRRAARERARPRGLLLRRRGARPLLQDPGDAGHSPPRQQLLRRRVSNCFVAVEAGTGTVVDFYTMASASISTPDLPAMFTKKLPRYPTLPAVRIGRLAVDVRFRGRGLGGGLLADAVARALTAAAASYALLVDAKNDEAVAFYGHHGFERFASQTRTLFLPLATAEKLLATQGGRKEKR